MGSPVSPNVKGRILALGLLEWSRSLIVKELKKSNIVISERTVSRVLKHNKDGAECEAPNEPGIKKKCLPRVYTSAIVKKVNSFITSHHPMTQRDMARRTGVSQISIHRLIHENLDHRKTKKVKVHQLADRAILKRKVQPKLMNQPVTYSRYIIEDRTSIITDCVLEIKLL
jgi:hypothetical protein